MLNPSATGSRPPVPGCRNLGLFMDRQSDHSATVLDQHRRLSRQRMFYAGPSMNPTLRPSDILHIRPYEDRKIRLGDVVVFAPSEGGQPIVHRVVSKEAHGVRTKGDNNTSIDPQILEPSRIIGQVVSAQRETKTRRVYGGIAGRVIGRLMNLRGIIDGKLSAVPRVAPRRLNVLKAVGALLFPRMRTKIVRFSGRNGSELQMLIGNQLIARLPSGQERWVIRRRFRFFVDEATLPTRDAIGEHLSTNPD
jgi:signal peptidase I